MAVDLPTFRLRFPEYVNAADATIQFWIDDSIAILDEDRWGDCYERAALLYAAHLLALSQNRAAAVQGASGDPIIVSTASGAVQSASVNGVSTSFALNKRSTDGTLQESLLLQTPYGQEYLALRDTCFAGGMLTGTVPQRVVT